MRFAKIFTAVFVAFCLFFLPTQMSWSENYNFPKGKIWFPDSKETKAVFNEKYSTDPEMKAFLKQKIYEIMIMSANYENDFLATLVSAVVFKKDSELLVITAAHVVESSYTQPVAIYIRDYKENVFLCKVEKKYERHDIAILKIEEPQKILEETVVASLSPVKLEEYVYCCGYYGGIAFVKKGLVIDFHERVYTNTEKYIYNTIEADAQIGHGFSGGPALNEKGELVGIVFATDSGYKSADISSFENIYKILNIKLPR